MFIFYLIVACFFITFFENIFIYLASFLFLLTTIFLFWSFKKFSIKKHLIYLLVAFLLMFFSFQIRNTLFFQNYYSPQFVGTWTILDSYWQQKYLFQNTLWDKFLYYSSQNYEIGESILTTAYFSWIQQKNYYSLDFNIWDFYSKYIYMKWYRGILYSKNSQTIGFSKLWFVQNLKKIYKDRIVSVYWENKITWLILGMSIGDKSLIPKESYQEFIDSSLVHVVAVSGWNLVILLLFLNIILFFLPYYFRLFIILSTIILYAFLCGMDTSVFRAVLMSWLILIALFFWRKISLRRSLSYTVFAMLCFNPYYLIYDLWFLLSFSAVLWISLFQRYRRFRHPKINQYVLPIIWAQLWVLPLLILYIGKISLLGFLANFILLPFTGILMIYWPLSVLFSYIFWSQFFLISWNFMMDCVYHLAHFFSIYNIYLSFNTTWLKVYLFLFGIILFAYLFSLKIEVQKN